ncbi:hypothetical protein NNJEOMEG_01756 [Fundidesulfovibrio magnetotacticus]|uniref:Ice-binding protein C-terminal domain-containing protein n=1 Tax=Fundidesulfovibrio magnetotacticus TaxID=2730080 RepID=A0A6V8LUB2_9BACT|nr:PEP-CTERM sorting domain-containing protein [Fundidesulfovibrio magnetotacticus]GFK93918.1 hypothetical protein NNJEOMEG_01756 [Fundidesulfovibrio magnetotacticus]
MKPFTLILALSVFFSGSALAAPEYTQDTNLNWDGYNSSTYVTTYGTKYGAIPGDVIGIPDIKQIGFTFNGTHLTAVSVDFFLPTQQSRSSWNSDKLKPGDIFINIDNDTDWDYIIHNPDSLVRPGGTATASSAQQKAAMDAVKNDVVDSQWTVYKADGAGLEYGNTATWAANYNMSTVYEYNLGGWDWRKNHPVQAKDPGDPTGITATVTWPTSVAVNTTSTDFWATWTLSGGGIELQGHHSMTVGFAVSCANDVFYERAPIPNPEPASMLLMGAGALGISFLRRRARSKEEV